jgi:hypothetical protein
VKSKFLLPLFFLSCSFLSAQEVYLGFTEEEIRTKTRCYYNEGSIICSDHVAVHEFDSDGRSNFVVLLAEEPLRSVIIDTFDDPPYIQTGKSSWMYPVGGKTIAVWLKDNFIEYELY